jgi:hypothetical protein
MSSISNVDVAFLFLFSLIVVLVDDVDIILLFLVVVVAFILFIDMNTHPIYANRRIAMHENLTKLIHLTK